MLKNKKKDGIGMSSVTERFQCTCGGVLESYFDNSTHEMDECCSKCGKSYSRTYDYYRDEYNVIECGGFGFVRLVGILNVQTYTISSKQEAMEYYERAKRNEFNYFIYSKSYIHFYDPTLKKGKVVWGGGKPEEYQEELVFDGSHCSKAFDSLLND